MSRAKKELVVMAQRIAIFDQGFLKEALSVPSVTYRAERMRDYILAFAKRRGIMAVGR